MQSESLDWNAQSGFSYLSLTMKWSISSEHFHNLWPYKVFDYPGMALYILFSTWILYMVYIYTVYIAGSSVLCSYKQVFNHLSGMALRLLLEILLLFHFIPISLEFYGVMPAAH